MADRHDLIRERAYHIWRERGQQDGCRPYPGQCAVGGAVFAIDGRAAMRSNHARSVG
jgi:hypothetical protein